MRWQALFGSLAVAVLAGCNAKGSASTSTTVTRADGSTFVFGYTEIFYGLSGGASLTGGVSMSGKDVAQGVECVVNSNTGVFVVTQAEIRHNGTPVINIPADAKRIDLTVDGGQVSVMADGVVLPLLDEDEPEPTSAG